MDWASILTAVLKGLIPFLPHYVAIFAIVFFVAGPLPGRGPRFLQRQDEWRRFKHDARRIVMSRAGHRCEAPVFLVWGRCQEEATEADHVYPHSRGGPTLPSNGQALCRGHNRSKAALRPPWWYVLGLEHRRRAYFPEGADRRIRARLTSADRTARTLHYQARQPRD